MPCIYLTFLGKVKDLRKIMNIDGKYGDDDFIYKFGLTKDFEQRKNGHKSEYKELGNLIDMKLVCFSFIDPLNISSAEIELKSILIDYKIEYKKHDELVVLSQNILKFVKVSYEKLAMKYSGHTESFIFEKSKLETSAKLKEQELNNKLENEKLNTKLKEQEFNTKLKEQELNHQLKNKDTIIREQELNHQLKNKDNIIREQELNHKLKEQEYKIREMELIYKIKK
jgi:hypothetical protein